MNVHYLILNPNQSVRREIMTGWYVTFKNYNNYTIIYIIQTCSDLSQDECLACNAGSVDCPFDYDLQCVFSMIATCGDEDECLSEGGAFLIYFHIFVLIIRLGFCNDKFLQYLPGCDINTNSEWYIINRFIKLSFKKKHSQHTAKEYACENWLQQLMGNGVAMKLKKLKQQQVFFIILLLYYCIFLQLAHFYYFAFYRMHGLYNLSCKLYYYSWILVAAYFLQ